LPLLVLVWLEIEPNFATRAQLAPLSLLLPKIYIDGCVERMLDASPVFGRGRDLLRDDSSAFLWFRHGIRRSLRGVNVRIELECGGGGGAEKKKIQR
jgi:hypothetical protein